MLTVDPISIIAQGFMKPLEQSETGQLYRQPCVVTTISGEEISCTFESITIANKFNNRAIIKLEDGTKVKYKPNELKSIKVKNKESRNKMKTSDTTAVNAVWNRTDFPEYNYVVFESVFVMGNKDLQFMQLLNPDANARIKVYSLGNSSFNSGSIGGVGVELKGSDTYLFIKDGMRFFEVKRKDYKKHFYELYGDCPSLISTLRNTSYKWNEIAGDVYIFNQVCEK